MEKKLMLSKNGLIYLLLLWILSNSSVTCSCNRRIPHGEVAGCDEEWFPNQNQCSYSCDEGYEKLDKVSFLKCSTSDQWISQFSTNVTFSINDLCKEKTRTGNRHVGLIVGITVGVGVGIIIITHFIVCIRKSKRGRVPGDESSQCFGPGDNPEQYVSNIRQQPNTNGTLCVSSFELPSCNGPYVHSFEQRIPAISSSCKYPGPPPSYSDIQVTPKESPPTYRQVAADPSRFDLYI